MTGRILTPNLLWEDFQVKATEFEPLRETPCGQGGEVTLYELYVNRIADGGEKVSVYVKIAKKGKMYDTPAVFLMQDVAEKISDGDLVWLAENGYIAVAVDFAGKTALTETLSSSLGEPYAACTLYPPSLSYANYRNAKENLTQIHGDAKTSPYYQWMANVRAVVAYLRRVEKPLSIGALAVNRSVAIGFATAETEKLSALVTLYGTGWLIPYGSKFAGQIKTEFSSDEHKFMAGLEAQAYAGLIECPTLMVCATNYPFADFERAYDTFRALRSREGSAILFAHGVGIPLPQTAESDVNLFLDKYLQGKKTAIPAEADLKLVLEDKKIKVTCTADKKSLETLMIFVSEGVEDPAYRTYRKIAEFTEPNDGPAFTAYYEPVSDAGFVTAYAEVRYKNGFTVATPLEGKKFAPKDVKQKPNSNVVFSTREEGREGIFEQTKYDSPVFCGMSLSDEPLEEKKKAAGIWGVDGKKGLLTFHVLRPSEDALLVMDVCADDDAEITVELIAAAFKPGEVIYHAARQVAGGKIWNKLTFEKSAFKTAEGFSLKNYGDVCAIRITGTGAFYVNNVLWI